MVSGRRVCSRSGNATFSNTVMSVKSAPNWNIMLILRRMRYRPSASRSGTDWPATAPRPEVGRSWPPISLSSVVLPLPLPPMMATPLPRGPFIEIPLRMGRRP